MSPKAPRTKQRMAAISAASLVLAAAILLHPTPRELVTTLTGQPETIAEASSGGGLTYHTVTFEQDGEGSVEITPPGTTVTMPGNYTFVANSTVTLTAIPATDYEFDRWEGGITGTQNPKTVTVGSAFAIRPIFLPKVRFLTATSSATEPTASKLVTITRPPAVRVSTVSYAVTGTATNGTDFTLASGQITFPTLSVSRTVEVDLHDDLLDEDNETVILTLSAVSNAKVPAPGVHTLTITDDDELPFASFSSTSSSATEGGASPNITVSLSPASGRTVTVPLSVAHQGASASDYTLNPAQVQFAPGQTSRTVPISLTNDTQVENQESLSLSISPTLTNAQIGTNSTHTLAISDNDYTLTTSCVNSAWGSLSPSSGTYNSGTQVSIVASPATGYALDHWTGDGTGTGLTRTVDMTGNKNVTAHFKPLRTLTLSIGPSGHTPAPGTTYPSAGQHTYTDGAEVFLDVDEEVDWNFRYWVDLDTYEIVSTEPAIVVQMTQNRSYAAVFVQEYSLVTSVSPAGAGTVTPAGTTYPEHNDSVTITAFPTASWRFDRWIESSAPATPVYSNPLTFNIVQDRSYTAHFVRQCTLNLSAGNGFIVSTPQLQGSSPYTLDAGTQLTLQAFPLSGYMFTDWLITEEGVFGAVSYPYSMYSFTLGSSRTVMAMFKRAILVAPPVVPPGSGWITVSPDGQGVGNDVYAEGSEISLQAVPAPGYQFSHWGDASETNPRQNVVVTENIDAIASAYFVPQHLLSITKVGEGTVSPASGHFGEGDIVTVTATPATGWGFSHWEGDAAGYDRQIQVNIDQAKSIKAVFAGNYSLATAVQGSGHILPSNGVYPAGHTANVVAVAQSGWKFSHWEDSATGSTNPLPLMFDSDKNLTAVFVPAYTLQTSVQGNGSVTLDPPGEAYDPDTTVNVEALPAPGWTFTHWTGNFPSGQEANPSISILMDQNKTLQAIFTAQRKLIVHVMQGGSVHFGNLSEPEAGPVVIQYSPPNGTITAHAIAHADYTFERWIAPAGAIINGDEIQLTMNTDNVISAVFTPTNSSPSGNHNLFVGVHGLGSVQLAPGVEVEGQEVISYSPSQVVNLTATPADGWEFVRWTGDATGTTPQAQVEMDAAFSLNALFNPIGESLEAHFDLQLRVEGGGTVFTDQLFLSDGESALLIAKPAFGWRFDRWEGDSTETSHISGIEMDANKDVTAVFVPGVSVVTDPEIIGGNVFFGPESDWVQSDPMLWYAGFASGATPQLTAVPESGYVFSHWEGDLSGTNASPSAAITSHWFIRPIFLPLNPLNVIVAGGGTVEITNETPVTDSFLNYYNPLTPPTLTLTPIPQSGWKFDRWDSTSSGWSDGPVTLALNEPTVALAKFAREKFSVSATLENASAGRILVSPVRSEYEAGSWVEISYIPASGYTFQGWEINGSPSLGANPLLMEINEDLDVTAITSGAFHVYTSVEGNGAVSVVPNQASYTVGDEVTITASPASGWYLDTWELDLSGKSLSVTKTIESDIYARAIFKPLSQAVYEVKMDVKWPWGADLEFNPPPPDGVITVEEFHVPASSTSDTTRHRSYSAKYPYQTLVTATISGSPEYQEDWPDLPYMQYNGWFYANAPSIHCNAGIYESSVTIAAPGGFTWAPRIIPSEPYEPVGNLTMSTVGQGSTSYGFGENGFCWLSNYQGHSVDRRPHMSIGVDAFPAFGWQFDHWTATYNGQTQTILDHQTNILHAPGDATFIAHFSPTPGYTYDLDVQQDGNGTVEVSPANPGPEYGHGETVSAVATPANGSRFVRWELYPVGESSSGGYSANPSFTFKIHEDSVLKAVFEPQNVLYLGWKGAGRVTRSPNKAIYNDDEDVTLTAIPQDGWVFKEWQGDAGGDLSSSTVSMSDSKVVTAVFAPRLNVEVDINDDGNWHNDEELEPGGSHYEQFGLVGELMRGADSIDNGVGRRSEEIKHWKVNVPIKFVVEAHDDVQPIIVSFNGQPVDNGILDVQWSNDDDKFAFSRNNIVVDEAFAGKLSLSEIQFPYDTSVKGPLPKTIYLIAKGFSDETTATLTMSIRDQAASDSIKFTIVSRLGNSHYFAAANDYLSEQPASVFTDKQWAGDPNQFVGNVRDAEQYRIAVVPMQGLLMRALPALNGVPGGGNVDSIYEAAEVFPDFDLIVTGAYSDESTLSQRIPTTIRGALIREGVVDPSSGPSFLDTYVTQEYHIFQESHYPLSPVRIEPGAVPITGGLYYMALGGLHSELVLWDGGAPGEGGADYTKKTTFIGTVPNPDSASPALLYIAMSDDGSSAKGYVDISHRQHCAGILMQSGATTWFRLDGGFSGAIAIRQGNGAWTIPVSTARHSIWANTANHKVNNYLLFKRAQ